MKDACAELLSRLSLSHIEGFIPLGAGHGGKVWFALISQVRDTILEQASSLRSLLVGCNFLFHTRWNEWYKLRDRCKRCILYQTIGLTADTTLVFMRSKDIISSVLKKILRGVPICVARSARFCYANLETGDMAMADDTELPKSNRFGDPFYEEVICRMKPPRNPRGSGPPPPPPPSKPPSAASGADESKLLLEMGTPHRLVLGHGHRVLRWRYGYCHLRRRSR